jgi:hypothetical protein
MWTDDIQCFPSPILVAPEAANMTLQSLTIVLDTTTIQRSGLSFVDAMGNQVAKTI